MFSYFAFYFVYFVVLYWKAAHEICVAPSIECSSGQPERIVQGQRLREHFQGPHDVTPVGFAIPDLWWEDWESGTFPIHSSMSRVFRFPQHRTLRTRHPLALIQAKDVFVEKVACTWSSKQAFQLKSVLNFRMKYDIFIPIYCFFPLSPKLIICLKYLIDYCWGK